MFARVFQSEHIGVGPIYSKAMFTSFEWLRYKTIHFNSRINPRDSVWLSVQSLCLILKQIYMCIYNIRWCFPCVISLNHGECFYSIYMALYIPGVVTSQTPNTCSDIQM